jgi:hypothetical protein
MMSDLLDAETKRYLFDEPRLQQFLGQMRHLQRRTVRQEQIWTAFTSSYRDLPSGPDRRIWLMSVLEDLSQRGLIELPVRHGRRWDRTSEIPLPTAIAISLQDTKAASRQDWQNHPWHPRLQWIFDLRFLTDEQVAFLQRVHSGLVAGWFDQTECFKYRSLQLTGDEKRLETLYRSSLFGPNRLTLEMLGCEPESLPLATEQFSAEPTMLIFENASPFMLARKIMKDTPRPAFGRLAYGAGKQVLKAAKYLPMIEPHISQVFYVGDLDPEGIAIASELQRRSVSIPVKPATDLHLAMLESASRLDSPSGWAVKDDRLQKHTEASLKFLDIKLRSTVSNMFQNARRIPEEALSLAAMAKTLAIDVA